MEDNVKEALAGLVKDSTKREALAEFIVEYVQPGHITSDLISLLLDSRTLKPGDVLIKKVRKGATVRTLVNQPARA